MPRRFSKSTVVVPFLFVISLVIAILTHCRPADAAQDSQLSKLKFIPWPTSVQVQEGDMALNSSTRITCANKALMPLGEILSGEIAQVAGLRLSVVQAAPRSGDIALAYDAKLTGEAYTLTVTDRATVIGANYNAVASGTVTLLQAIDMQRGLFPKTTLPKLTIQDQPAMSYRGAMLDIARKPYSISTLKQCVIAARFYKIRYIHLHMSDENAWTFPSTKFPQLGKGNGAWAGGNAPKVYPLEELKDLVAFGDARGVIFVPELETPGHSGQLRGGPLSNIFGYKTAEGKIESPGITNIASEEMFQALDTLVGEFCDVFKSSPYIHMGCDEASVEGIEKYPDVKALMARENLKGSGGVFIYYVKRMAEMVHKRGKQMIVWEGAPLGAPKDQVIWMPWRGGSADIMQAGYRVIDGMSAQQYKKGEPMLLGKNALLWQYPEEAAMPHMRYATPVYTEPVWNPDVNLDPAYFVRRQAMLEPVMDKLLAGFTLKMQGAVDPTAFNRVDPVFTDKLTLSPEIHVSGGKVHYTLDESEPTAQSPVFDKPLTLTSWTTVKARWFSDDGKTSMFPLTRLYRRVTALKHDAIGAKVTLKPVPGNLNPGMLTDGMMAAGDSFNDPGWIAWWGPTGAKEITLELKKPTAIRNIRGHFDNAGFGVILPAKVEMSVSDDGKTFRPVGAMDSPTAWPHRGWFSIELATPVTARYVRLSATPGGEWNYTDEVMVNGELPGPNFRHEAMGKPITVAKQPTYKSPGLAALTDGMIGNTPQYACLGYLGFMADNPTIDATIDMGKVTDIRVVGGHFVQEVFGGVYISGKVDVFVSDDGKEFKPAGIITHPRPLAGNALAFVQMELKNVKARYVRFKCYGGDWVILDELFVNPIK